MSGNHDDKHPHPDKHQEVRRDAELLFKLDQYADDLQVQVDRLKELIDEEMSNVPAELKRRRSSDTFERAEED